MCGNLYGSNEVINADLAEGNRNLREKEEKYNYTIFSDRNMCCKSLLILLLFAQG